MARPEQTEKPTPKRRSEARDKGTVAKSQDLSGAVLFLVAIIILHANLVQSVSGVGWTMQRLLQHINTRDELTIFSVWTFFIQAVGGVVWLLVLLFIASFAIAILANVLQFGFMFNPKLLAPKFSKLNPLAGFKRLVSTQSLVQLAKQILKLLCVFVIIYPSVNANIPAFLTLAHASPMVILEFLNDLTFSIGWKFGALLVVLGLADFIYQKWTTEQSLKMSKSEVKDEYRQAEGNPEAKGAVKRRQREISRRRMMAAVPKATVVVTNPTHFAIALEWDDVNMDAPIVTAKGADLMAKRIRELAREHNVPIMENPILARAIYAQVEIDQPVPPNLYAAVAQVIAFVFKLKRRTIA